MSIHDAIYVPLSKQTDDVSKGVMAELNRLHWCIAIRDKFIANHKLWDLYSDEVPELLHEVPRVDVMAKPDLQD